MARLRLQMLAMLVSALQHASSFHPQRAMVERCSPAYSGDPGGLAGVRRLRAEGRGRDGCFGMPSPGGEGVLRLRGGNSNAYPRFEPPPSYTEVWSRTLHSLLAFLQPVCGSRGCWQDLRLTGAVW